MNESYFNSGKNTALSSKPSKAIRLLLMVLFVCLFSNVASAQTNTWDGSSNSNWNTAANWSLNLVPTAVHDVVIPNSNAANANPIVNTSAICRTFTINGGNRANNITISGSNSLTVSGAVIIGAGSGSGDDKLLNVGTGTLSCASITVAAAGSTNRISGVTLSSGMVNVTGNVTMGDTNDDFTFTGSGTLNIGGTITGGTLTPYTGTVNYNNVGAQNIGNYTYNNLTLSGSGTKTFVNATIVTNNLSITSGAIANLGTFTHTAGTLSLGGVTQVSESWGSTSSPADNKNDTYFTATTGIVNNSCTAPTITTQPTALSICENTGGSFSVSATGASSYQWQYSADNINWTNIDAALAPYVSGYATATFTLTNTPAAWTNNYVRCIVRSSSGCRINSNSVLLIVKALPVIVPNEVGETCSVSNNGSISPTFSGGLFNVRYIRLTQKYADYQQVAEIQAFEIFSGTNVALSSGGAVASASSTYSASYPTSEVNDGISATNGNMWHSSTTNINEWIQIDLQSGKNIDYLRIHNRTDCCQERGQNMLLELFDGSNNLVYSRTVNLWEGVNGAHYIDVNVLDLSWADGSTTLNRTVLDSGTYTLTYADAIGCSVSSPILINALNSVSVGGTVSGGSTPICLGSPTGTLTLSGHTGTVVQWDKRLNSGTWEYAGGSTTTFSETPYAAGTWEYRALVQSGSCTSAYSSIQTIVVSPTPVSGGIYTGNNAICINSSTGAMNLTGYTGSVVRWEKRLLPSSTWTTIANTTDTYTESPSVGGTWEYRAVVGSGSCATVYSNVKQVVVNPELTIALTNSNATICQTTTTASFAYSATTGSPAGWIVNFDSAAISAGFSSPQNNGISGTSGTITVNVPSSIAPGVYNANLTVITYWPSCSSVNYPITVTVGVSTPIIGTITHLDCATPTGSVVLSGLPTSGTINQTGSVVTSYPITGTTMTISGLAAGIYSFSASNGTCNSSATGNVVIKPVDTNIWNGSVWSDGTPNSNQKIVFSGNYPPAVDPDVDIAGCTCRVTGSTDVVIKTGRNLIIANEVTVVGTGTLTFENNASLVQINDAAVNSGNIIYKRATSTVLTSDYTYWSSPVVNQNLGISPSYASGMFYSYNDFAVPEDWKRESASTVMAVGKGYIIRGPQVLGTPPPLGLYEATFTGVPNNGIKTIAIGPTGTSNLLGNPYPSAIDADEFLATNSSLVEGTIYFWTHNTAIQLASNITNGTAGSGVFAYTSDDYASYNVTGGVGTGTGNLVNGVEQTVNKPTGKIAAGQAFFTTSLGTGTVTFNNAMRISGNNTQFFKTRKPKGSTTTTLEKNRVWLNMTNKKGAFKQTLVGYVTGATNDYDSRFDGESFDANEYVDFYSINQDKNLVIQGRALPFDQNDEVPLGYRTAIDGTFTINIDQVDGVLTNQSVFLEDKLTNTVFDLKSGNYTFKTAAGTFNDRFVLRYASKTLATGDFEATINQVVVSVKNKQIRINSFVETIDKVVVFDLSGRQIYEKNKVNNNELLISNLVSSHQILIVKTTLQNGNTATNKVIY